MALGRKGLTCGVIKGLTVCCLLLGLCLCFTVSTLAVYFSAQQRNTQQHVTAVRREICHLY
ncbi:unnamed protein product, partial [Staurois parvus]